MGDIMNNDFELLQDIYKTSEMSTFAINKVLEKLEKDTKIQDILSKELKQYEKHRKISKKKLKENKQTVKETNFLAKFSSNFGITMELLRDNSDEAISEMLIKGINMGVKEMKKKIKEYEKDIGKEIIELAKNFLTYQEEEIKKLKEYV